MYINKARLKKTAIRNNAEVGSPLGMAIKQYLPIEIDYYLSKR